MSYNIKCGICWEEKCLHWEKIVNTSTSSGILGKKLIITDYLTCTLCSLKYKILPISASASTVKTVICDCKDNWIYISNCDISDSIMHKLNSNKYIRSKCVECKGSGKVLRDKFTLCTNCYGVGGVYCKNCKGSGLLKEYRATDGGCYFDGKVNSVCRFGFEIICYVCDGSRLMVSGKNEIDCKSCTVEPDTKDKYI